MELKFKNENDRFNLPFNNRGDKKCRELFRLIIIFDKKYFKRAESYVFPSIPLINIT